MSAKCQNTIAAICLKLQNPNLNLSFWSFKRKKWHVPLTPAMGNVHTNFGFSSLFNFQLQSTYGTGRQMDGWTKCVLQPIRTTAQSQ